MEIPSQLQQMQLDYFEVVFRPVFLKLLYTFLDYRSKHASSALPGAHKGVIVNNALFGMFAKLTSACK